MTSRALRENGTPSMMRGMRWPFFNHIRLLRYAGFFTYLSVGTPLITNWATERLNQLQRPNFALLLWTLWYRKSLRQRASQTGGVTDGFAG